VLEEQLLDPGKHDRHAFTSGVIALDDFLRRFAAQQSKKGIAVVRVLIDTDASRTILGYYSLGAAEIDVGQMDERTRHKLPRYPVPCFRMGRLAAHSGHHGTGLGRLLIGLAVDRCLQAKKHIAAYALLVNAKDDKAKTFYEHYGFTACRDSPLTLYLPLGS
jgi:GNAT superfamily N-acetyltransferase